ncbi:hypothetical protein Tco_1459486 [Tanacetum coccineum]
MCLEVAPQYYYSAAVRFWGCDRIVKGKYGDTRPEDEFERVLYGDLRVMFEPDIKSDVWRMLQGYRVTTWKLIDSYGVHFVRFDNLYIFMLVERRYPLTPITIADVLNKKLQTDHQNEMCYQLLKLMIQKMNIKFRGGLLGLKRLHGFLEVTAAQVHNGNYAKCAAGGIEDIDADVDVSLVDETQERQDDDLIFDTGVLDDVEMPEITLAQTLTQIKAAKPKVVTTADTTTTTTRPKDKGVVVQEPSEFRVPQEIKPSSSKDKGKGIMIEPEVPLKRKDQIALDEQIARDIQAKLDAELLEELLAERLQSKEREELTHEEKAKLFMELMEKRRNHFAALRAQEKRNRPPTKAQKRTQMSTYLKHMGGYTYKQLKGKSFDEIQKLFHKEMKRVNTFVAMGSEVQENKEKKEEVTEMKSNL